MMQGIDLVLFIYFVLTTIVVIDSQMSECPSESIDLRTTVALVNSSVNFSCKNENTEPFNLDVNLEINGKKIIMNEKVHLGDLVGIQLEFIKSSDGEENIIGFEIIINATIQTNNTELQCFLFSCVSNKASLIVVDKLPNFSKPPLIVLLNSSLMNVSWAPIWPHPVLAYTIMVTADKGPHHKQLQQQTAIITSYTTSTTYYIIDKSELLLQQPGSHNFNNNGSINAGIDDCLLIKIAIMADTDVGKIEESPMTSAGFPTDFNSNNFSNTRFTVAVNHQLSSPYLEVSTENPPSVCKYEQLMYTLDIQSNNQSLFTKGYDNLSDNITLKFDDLIALSTTPCLENVHITINIVNEIGQTRNWSIYNNDLLCLFQIQSSSIVITRSSSELIPQPTNNNSKQGLLGNRGFMIGIFTGAGILLILICILSGLLGFCIYKNLRRSERTRNISGSQGCVCEDFTLPQMINNDNYDHAVQSSESTTHLYDTIMYEAVLPPPTHPPSTFTNTNNIISPSTRQHQTQHNNITRPLYYDKLGEAGITPPPSSPDDYVEMREGVPAQSYDDRGSTHTMDISPRYTIEPGVGGINY